MRVQRQIKKINKKREYKELKIKHKRNQFNKKKATPFALFKMNTIYSRHLYINIHTYYIHTRREKKWWKHVRIRTDMHYIKKMIIYYYTKMCACVVFMYIYRIN